jgi:AbiV family abortive infection protein
MTSFRFTVGLLREYSAAALQNAGELLDEASLLLEQGHAARAYFLGVACIEETGKGLLAFDAQGRNLADSAVTAKVRRSMEDHSKKITNAFSAMLQASSSFEEAVKRAVELMIHLKRGREPSMYTDIQYDESKVQLPAKMVRTVAARDCIRLAGDCLAHARKHVAERKPANRSAAEDKVFAMKDGKFAKMLNTEGFWWYYIEQLKSGKKDFPASAVAYERDYFSKGKEFERPNE